MNNLLGYIALLLISIIVAFILGVILSEKVKDMIIDYKFSWNNITSIIATYSILIVVLIYTLWYIPRKAFSLATWLDKCGLSFYDMIVYIINHSQTYVELATCATLLGLYHLLNDNRKILKQKIKMNNGMGSNPPAK